MRICIKKTILPKKEELEQLLEKREVKSRSKIPLQESLPEHDTSCDAKNFDLITETVETSSEKSLEEHFYLKM